MQLVFERFVAWRYLRERGSRRGSFTMAVGVLFALGAGVFAYVEHRLAGVHPFELGEHRLPVFKLYQWSLLALGGALLLELLVAARHLPRRGERGPALAAAIGFAAGLGALFFSTTRTGGGLPDVWGRAAAIAVAVVVEGAVAWRYRGGPGARLDRAALIVAGLLSLVALALVGVERGVPDELALKQLAQWAKIGALVAGVLVFIFGFFHSLQSIFTTISTYGVFLGTAALVLVLSVMNGFESDLRHKILGSNAHILVTRDDGAFTEYREVEQKLDGLCAAPGLCIVGHSPYLTSEVVIAANSNYGTVIIKGVDPKSAGTVTDLAKNLGQGSMEELLPQAVPAAPAAPAERPDEPKAFDTPAGAAVADDEPVDFSGGAPDAGAAGILAPPPMRPAPRPLKPDPRVAALDGILVGRELAKNLHLYVGEEVQVVSPIGQDTPTGQMPRAREFRIAGVFFTGMYEYDAKIVYVTIPALQQFLSLGDEVTGVEVKLAEKNVERTQPVVDAIAEHLGPGYHVQDWKELNKSLFSALKLEQIAMFLVLTIIILVASFSIISNLIMVVVEKGREIATLKSIGASDWAIMRIFVLEGMFIGALGTLFGISIGIGFCLLLKYYGLPLDSDVYYIDRLPVAMSPISIAAVAGAGLVISVVATIYPAYIGARLRPIDGLRQ